MAKIVKEYEARKSELLETSRMLFFSKGYENTSVNDIIKAVGIAKGTFYHYFKSKEDLLNELITIISENLLEELKKIINISNTSAIEKLNSFFSYAGNYKVENKETIIVMSRVLNSPENMLLRKKLEDLYLRMSSPLLEQLIVQGVKEGCFETAFPDLVPHMLLPMGVHVRDQFVEVLLKPERTEEDIALLCRGYTMYQDSIERILGAPEGSISFVSDSLIRSFFV